MVNLQMRQLTFVVLTTVMLLLSTASSVRGGTTCGTWEARIDADAPLMMIDQPQTSPDDCSATFNIRSSTNRIGPDIPKVGRYKLEGYVLDLGKSPVNSSANWSPSFGINPDRSLLMPEVTTVIRVRPNDSFKDASVRIEGQINRASMSSDFIIFMMKTAFAFNPVPCTPDYNYLREVLNSDVETYNLLKDVYALATKKPIPDIGGAAKELGRGARALYARAGEILDERRDSCAKDLIKQILLKSLDNVFKAVDIENAFINFWLPMTVDHFFYYKNKNAVATLVYIPLHLPAPASPPPSPTLYVPPPTVYVPPTVYIPPPTVYVPPPTVYIPPTVYVPPTQLPQGPIINYFVAHGDNLKPGDCTSISWSVSNVREVYLDGRGVAGTGGMQVCPRQTTNYTLRIVALDGSVINRTVTISVTAACTQLQGHWGDATNAVYAAANAFASSQGICSGQVQVISVQSVQWANSSYGCPEPGKLYLQVISPGYKIVLRSPSGRQATYNTDQSGRIVKSCG